MKPTRILFYLFICISSVFERGKKYGDQIKDSLMNGHDNALKEVQKKLPKDSAIFLITTMISVGIRKKSIKEASKELYEHFGESIEVYEKAFGNYALKDILDHTDYEPVQKLRTDKFKKKVDKFTGEVGEIFLKWKKGDIETSKLVDELSKTQIQDITLDIVDAMGIKRDSITEKDKDGRVTEIFRGFTEHSGVNFRGLDKKS